MQNLQPTISYQTIWNLAVQLAGRTIDNMPEGESVMLQSFFASQLEDLWGKEAWPELCDNLMAVQLSGNAFNNPYQLPVVVSGAGEVGANGNYTWNGSGGHYINDSNNDYFIVALGIGWGLIGPVSVPNPPGPDLTGSVRLYQVVGAINGTWIPATSSIGFPHVPYTGASPAPTVTQNLLEIGDILGIYDLDPRTVCGWHRFESSRWLLGNGRIYVDTHLESVWVDWQLPCPDLLDPTLVGQANEAALMAVTLPRRFRNPLAFRAAAMLLAVEDPALADKYTQMAEVELLRQVSHLNQPWWRIETGKR